MSRAWDLCCICGLWRWLHRVLPHAYQPFDVNRELEEARRA